MIFFASLLTPPRVLFVVFVLSALALAAAFTAEFQFHLVPCILCLAQRVPFVMAIVFSLTALAASRFQTVALWILAVLFLINSSVAVFQVGEEQAWWGLNAAGQSQACSSPNQTVQDIETLYQSMSGAALGDCAHPIWSWHGVTFAVLNIILCLFLAAIAFYGAACARRKT